MSLAIVISNKNTKIFLKHCIKSIYKNNKLQDLKIVVVDNNSSDGSVNMVQNMFKDITLIKNEKDLGPTGGYNIGIKASRGRHVMLLNSDINIPLSLLFSAVLLLTML